MSFLFGKHKTPTEMMREHQRAINQTMREVDRERTGLQYQEKKIIMDVKKAAKGGQMEAAKIMAKELIKTRNQTQKLYQMKAQLQSVGLRINSLKSTQAMAEAMKGVTKAIIMMNRQMNLPAMQKILMEFEIQTEKMDMKEEMMNDTMEEMMDQNDDEEKSSEILNQVLDEIGINLAQDMVDTPVHHTTATQFDKEADIDISLQARLDELKK